MRLLCLVADDDPSVGWLAAALPAAAIVTETGLRGGWRVSQSQDGRGTVTRLRAPDGAEVEPDLVLCRLGAVTPVAEMAAEDGLYAAAEWAALLASWLRTLGRGVLNQPDPQGLAGVWRSPEEWAQLAFGVGLDAVAEPVAEPDLGPGVGPFAPAATTARAVVIGDRVFADADLPSGQARGLARLAAAAGLGVRPATHGRPLLLLHGTPVPDLAATGADGQAALRALVTDRTTPDRSTPDRSTAGGAAA